MTVLEKGKFVKNFVRIKKDGALIRVPHSNFRGYSAKDIEAIEDKIDSHFWENWEKYLADLRKTNWSETYSDWQHFLFALNSISDEDIRKYDLPTSPIAIEL